MENRLPPISTAQDLNMSLPLLLHTPHIPTSLPQVSSLFDTPKSQSPPITPMQSIFPQSSWTNVITPSQSTLTLQQPSPYQPQQVSPSYEKDRVLAKVRLASDVRQKMNRLEANMANNNRTKYIDEIKKHTNKRCEGIVTNVDYKYRLILPGENSHKNWLKELEYPLRDDEPDDYLEAVPGFEPRNRERLQRIFLNALKKTRCATEEAIAEVEGELGRELQFRTLSVSEVRKKMCYTMGRFKKARSMICGKFKQYIRNRKWIENVATRQRRGCLSHKQNNILRLWLFSNFSDPYPSAQDKKRLIVQAQLDKTQLNNWLINARSRVWKPTIETMHEAKVKESLKKKDNFILDDPINLDEEERGQSDADSNGGIEYHPR